MSVWAFNLRSYGCLDPEDTDSESDGDAPGDKNGDSIQLPDTLDISSRYDAADYKPNPWTIAKINAASRSHGSPQRTGTDGVDSGPELKAAASLSDRSNIQGRKFLCDSVGTNKPPIDLKGTQTSSAVHHITRSPTASKHRLPSKVAQPTSLFSRYPASTNFHDIETSAGLKLDSAPIPAHTVGAPPLARLSSNFHNCSGALPQIADALSRTSDVPLPTFSTGLSTNNLINAFPASFSSPAPTVRANVYHYSSPIPQRRNYDLSNPRHRSKPVHATRPVLGDISPPFDENEDPDASWSTLPPKRAKTNRLKTTVIHSGKFRLPIATPLCRRTGDQEGEPVGRRSITLYKPPPMRPGMMKSEDSDMATSSSPRQLESLSASSGLSSSPSSLDLSAHRRTSDQTSHSPPEVNANTMNNGRRESNDDFSMPINIPSVLTRYPQTKILLAGQKRSIREQLEMLGAGNHGTV